MSDIAINTGTTGLTQHARVIGLAIAGPDDEMWETKVRPPADTEMEPAAQSEHGIVLADLDEAPTFPEVAGDFVAMANGNVAYFWDFNGLHRRVLLTELSEAGLEAPWDEAVDLETLAIEAGIAKPRRGGRLSLDEAARALDLAPQLDNTPESRTRQILSVLNEMESRGLIGVAAEEAPASRKTARKAQPQTQATDSPALGTTTGSPRNPPPGPDDVLRWQFFCLELTEVNRKDGLEGAMADYKLRLQAEMKRRGISPILR